MSNNTKELSACGVWRACNKIRAAVGRIHINFWDYFIPLDTQNNNLISESCFINVLSGPLGILIGLSNQEVCEIADYFRTQDGRISYTQFCTTIHENNPDFADFLQISGQEWEDPLQTNCLSPSEQRRLEIVITNIVSLINRRKLSLRPYFQDYELISKNCGVVTFAHFARVLHFLNITLAPEEMNLLLKKFAKDSYTVNYVAFIQVVEEIQAFFEKKGLFDKGGNLLENFPGRIISVKLPKLPRPEVGKIRTACVFPQQLHFLPIDRSSKRLRSIHEVMLRIQDHVYKNHIRVAMYFQDFDTFNVGRISEHQFRRGLDALCDSALGKLYISNDEIQNLISFYKDPNEMERVCWRTFEDDVEQVFTVKHLQKHPNCKVSAPPDEIKSLPRKGFQEWDCTELPKIVPDETMEKLYGQTIRKIMLRTKERQFSLRQYLRDHDKHNRGHISRAQLRRVLAIAAIPLTHDEILSLEYKFNDDLGFQYLNFLNDLTKSLNDSLTTEKKLDHTPDISMTTNSQTKDKNIDLILAKIRAKVVCNGIKVNEFFRKFDTRNVRSITKKEFHRGLDQLKCELTVSEVNTLMDNYTVANSPEKVDYWKFTDEVEGAMAQGYMEKSPLVSPVQHVPSESTPRSFLNFDERRILIRVLDLLASNSGNLEDTFKDFDKKLHTGAVSKNQLMRALSMNKLLTAISVKETDILFKCFTVGHMETDPKFDYISLISVLNVLRENRSV
ncbi:uncharacterized protein LOC106644480 [Copidosoma floridanum]|uniref:uncharacterized protein LOC106644480 n=1 Tax=Copidosoma floridanum TaxID=29053 RepID=UPI000C6FA35A|nr:uncharacterized protein LOC106644480 [Copidosoma floridanum]